MVTKPKTFIDYYMNDPLVLMILMAAMAHIIIGYVLYSHKIQIPVIGGYLDIFYFMLICAVWVGFFILALRLKYKSFIMENKENVDGNLS